MFAYSILGLLWGKDHLARPLVCWFVSSLAATLLAGGCGSVDPDPDGSPSPESTDRNTPESSLSEAGKEDYAKTMCALYERCELGLVHLYGTGQECVAIYERLIEEAVAAEPALAETYASFTPCAELQTAECPEPGFGALARFLDRLSFSCFADALREEGETCAWNGCVAGLRCTEETYDSCGVCEKAPEAWCDSHSQCSDDQWCDSQTNRCEPLVPVGESCSTSFACRTGNCTSGVCVLGTALGEPCQGENECSEYLRCIQGTCQSGRGQGQSCASDAECRFSYGCRAGTCQLAALHAAVGEPCTIGRQACVEGAYCDIVDGVCKSNAVGAECDLTCGTDRLCVDGACAPRRPDGEPCESDFDCVSGRCFEDSCAPQLSCLPF